MPVAGSEDALEMDAQRITPYTNRALIARRCWATIPPGDAK